MFDFFFAPLPWINLIVSLNFICFLIFLGTFLNINVTFLQQCAEELKIENKNLLQKLAEKVGFSTPFEIYLV